MQSVRRKKPHNAPFGDYQALCAYCGVMWYRFAGGMGMDRSGQLSCKDCRDFEGRDAVSLTEENAQGATEPRMRMAQPVEGNFDKTALFDPGTYLSSAEEIEL